MLSYQELDHSNLTPVEHTLSKSKKGTDPYESVLIEAIISPQYEQWTKATPEEITNVVKLRTWYVFQKSEVTKGANAVVLQLLGASWSP